jgi:hypothetical protein
MTINEMLDLLKDTVAKLDDANIDDEAKFELEDLVIETKRAIIKSAINPLKDISQMTVVDVSQLPALTKQLGEVIEQEKKRTALIGKIVGIAKGGLKGAGVPLPF